MNLLFTVPHVPNLMIFIYEISLLTVYLKTEKLFHHATSFFPSLFTSVSLPACVNAHTWTSTLSDL